MKILVEYEHFLEEKLLIKKATNGHIDQLVALYFLI